MSDKKPGRFRGETTAFLALFLDNAGVLTIFGVIHSVLPTGRLYLSWQASSGVHYRTALDCGTLSVILWVLAGKNGSGKHFP